MPTHIAVTDLLSALPSAVFPRVTEKCHRAVHLPGPDPTFLDPTLRLIHGSLSERSPIVVVSAPGAVGKTALAKRIASACGWYLWDLSALKLGDNSFVGTIAQCFGSSELQPVLESLKSGAGGFVIDALDEAEILSGWPRVEGFLDELADCSRSSVRVCLVLLARSETATLVSYYLDEKKRDGESPYSLLEIDYFDESSAQTFVGLQVERLAAERQDPSLRERYRRHTAPFGEAVDAIFESVYGAFSLTSEDAWTSPAIRSFLGYAPVLQAIATYLSSFGNPGEARQRIKEGAFGAQGAGVASSIMWELLSREQGKVVRALKNKGIPEGADWDGWESVYEPSEQLGRIVQYALGDGQSLQAPELETINLPSWLVPHYQHSVASFLPQHPFVRDGEFAGPAFCDFVLAESLRTGSAETKTAVRRHLARPQFSPTPLLLQFYQADETELVDGEDIGFLYESFSSRDHVHRLTSATLMFPPDANGAELHRLELFDSGDADGEHIVLHVRNQGAIEVVFHRRLRNAFLDVRGSVVFGNPANDFEASDCDVSCDEFCLRSNVFVVQHSAVGQAVVIDAQRYSQEPPVLEIQTRGPGRLLVTWPGAEQYPWSQYCVNAQDPPEQQASADAFLALRRILSWFRRDRKADLARHRDLIENVAVGEQGLRRLMLRYLFETGVVKEINPLYVVDIDTFTRVGINWTALQAGRMTEETVAYLAAFEEWVDENG